MPSAAHQSPHAAASRLAAASAALVLSCQAVIGIEDISDSPRPYGAGGATSPVGAAGDAAQPGAGGASGADSGMEPVGGASSGGTTSEGAASGESGLAGAASFAGNAGSAGTTGETPLGQAGADGLPDDAPEPDPPDEPPADTITVSGRVIDFFRRPVPNVPVSIAGQTDDTDAEGHFTITGVEPPYDAQLLLSMTRDGTPARYGYVYEALTRTDPTLQVYSALPQRSASSLAVAINDVDFSDPDRHVAISFNSPDARFVESSLQADSSAILATPEWTGPATTTGTAHAISLLRADGEPPHAYEAHQAQPLTATHNGVAVLSLDLAPGSLSESVIGGFVTGGASGDRSHFVAVRFADGTALPIIEQTSFVDEFGYLVPDLEDSSLIVAAADGFSVPYAVAWHENIAPDSGDIELGIPNPVLLSSPQNNAVITPSTPFAWSPAAQTAQTFLWHLEFTDSYAGILVITSRTQIELPDFPDGFSIPEGTSAYWSVETHGDAADTDALTGEDGFLDPFAIGTPYPVGPRPSADAGYYTESARSSLVMGSD